MDMLKNYFLVAIRVFKKERLYVFINILGLSIGLVSVLCISLYVNSELSYDKCHSQNRNIFRLGMSFKAAGFSQNAPVVPGGWAPRLKERVPSVNDFARSLWIRFPTTIRNNGNNKILLTEKIRWADPSILRLLNFNFIKGNRNKALDQVNSMVVSESAARKLFSDQDPIGQIVTIKHPEATHDKEMSLIISGVYQDLPSNSHLKVEYLVNLESLKISYEDKEIPFDDVGMEVHDFYTKRKGQVIGVVKDFPIYSVQKIIEPLMITPTPHRTDNVVYVRLPHNRIQEKIKFVEKTWNDLIPNTGFDYWFLNDEFNRLYKSERRLLNLNETFSIVAAIITMLGIFGLSSYTAKRWTKNIAIRKAMGAGLSDILILFFLSFAKISIIAFIIASPICYFLVDNWLSRFAYKTSIDPMVFVFSILAYAIVTAIIIAYESLRAAFSDISITLKNE